MAEHNVGSLIDRNRKINSVTKQLNAGVSPDAVVIPSKTNW